MSVSLRETDCPQKSLDGIFFLSYLHIYYMDINVV